jgi:hypothetical protein
MSKTPPHLKSSSNRDLDPVHKIQLADQRPSGDTSEIVAGRPYSQTPIPRPSSRPALTGRLRDTAVAERRTALEATAGLFELVKRFISWPISALVGFATVHGQSRGKEQVCLNERTLAPLRLTSLSCSETFHQARNGGSMPVCKPLEGLVNSHGRKNEMKLGREGDAAIVTCGSNGIGPEIMLAAGRI